MVELRGVKKYYGHQKDPIKAADNLSFRIEEGEFVIITGPSGSGKTTILNLMGGMVKPDAGDIYVAEKKINGMKDTDLSAFRAEMIGFVFQFQSMIQTLNATQNILLPSLFTKRPIEEDRALELLDRVGLRDRANAYQNELSIGQQRRVCIVRALINNPKILLCDEPTGDLDFESEKLIMDMIQNANKDGSTVILVTHNPDLKSCAGRLFSLVDGRFIEE